MLPKRPGINKRNEQCHDASSATTAQKLMETTTEVFSSSPKSEETFAETVVNLSTPSNDTTNSETTTMNTASRPPSTKSSTKNSTKIAWGSLGFWKSETWKTIQKKMQGDATVLPPRPFLFRPLLETPLKRLRVVILGVEPWAFAPAGVLDGMAYSFNGTFKNISSCPTPLQNIIVEAQNDVDIGDPKTGNLRFWARQGVLLWNAVPTVKRGFPLSCNDWGWEELTSEVLETAYLANPNTVFVFWDHKTHFYKELLPDDAKVVVGVSPGFGTSSEFFGSKPFSKVNELLTDSGQRPIDWKVK